MERSILFLLLFLHHVSCTSLKRLEIGLQVYKKKNKKKKVWQNSFDSKSTGLWWSQTLQRCKTKMC